MICLLPHELASSNTKTPSSTPVMSRPRLRVVVCILLLFATGCSGWIRPEMGFATSTTLDSKRQGIAGGMDLAVGDRSTPLAFNLGLRGRVTPQTGDAIVNMGLGFLLPPKPVGFYVLGGANVLQLGSTDGDVSFGMFSPVGEMGVIIKAQKDKNPKDPPNGTNAVTLGTRIEYDFRFTHQPNEGFLTFNLGYALMFW